MSDRVGRLVVEPPPIRPRPEWKAIAAGMIVALPVACFTGIVLGIWHGGPGRDGRTISVIDRIMAAIIGSVSCKAIGLGIAAWGRPTWLARNPFALFMLSVGSMLVGVNSGSIRLAANFGASCGLIGGLVFRLFFAAPADAGKPTTPAPRATASGPLWDRTLDG